MSTMRAPPFESYIFDLDGTLLNTLGDLAACVHLLRAELGLPARDDDFVRRGIGHGLDALLRHSFSDLADIAAKEEHRLEGLRARWRLLYAENLTGHTQPYDGVVETIEALHACGAPLAIASNKPERFCHELVRHFAWEDIFPVVLGGDSAPERKPSPAPLLLACAQLGVDARGACMIGDSPPDILAAQAANFAASVACTWGYTDEATLRGLGPTRVIDSMRALNPRSGS